MSRARHPRVLLLFLVLALGVASCASPPPSATDDPLNTPQDVPFQSPEREAEFLSATEQFLGTTIEETGFTRAAYLNESYRWCAMLSAVGSEEAYRILRSEVERTYPPSQAELQYSFARAGNAIIERYLCQ